MGTKLLRHLSIFGAGVYLLALAVVSLAFPDHALQLKWMLWGIGEMLFFFVGTTVFYPRWKTDDRKRFLLKVFLVAFVIRGLYAFLICYYYYYQTGWAFEYSPGDSLSYHRTAVFLAKCLRGGHLKYISDYLNAYTMGYSDQGYMYWLTIIYTIFGPSLLTPRLFKALMSAYLCVVVYKLTERTISERAARLAAVICLFTPILIQICGMHTKEMELIFLSVLALERIDYLIRSKKYTFWNIFFPILLVVLIFGFRTITAMCIIFALLVFILFGPNNLMTKKGKIITLVSMVVLFFAFLLTPVGSEMKLIYRLKFTDWNYQMGRAEAEGFKHAELMNPVYMVPGAFVVPLAPMVEETGDHNKMINGSTFVKNYLAFFVMLSLLIVFRQKKWRDFSLIGTYLLSYVTIIILSFANNSERYHEPVMPLFAIMSAYAMTRLRRSDMKLFYVYCALLFVALVGWNWLKLSARGLV